MLSHPQLAHRLSPLPCHHYLHLSLFTLPFLHAKLPLFLPLLPHLNHPQAVSPGHHTQSGAGATTALRPSLFGISNGSSGHAGLAQPGSLVLRALSQALLSCFPVLPPGCRAGSCLQNYTGFTVTLFAQCPLLQSQVPSTPMATRGMHFTKPLRKHSLQPRSLTTSLQ